MLNQNKYKKEFKQKIKKMSDVELLNKWSGTCFTFQDEVTRDWFLCFKTIEETNNFIDFLKKNHTDLKPKLIHDELNPELNYQYMVGNIDTLFFLKDTGGFNFKVIKQLKKEFNGILKDVINYKDCYFSPEMFLSIYEDLSFWKETGLKEVFKKKEMKLIADHIEWIQTWRHKYLSLLEFNTYCLKLIDSRIKTLNESNK